MLYDLEEEHNWLSERYQRHQPQEEHRAGRDRWQLMLVRIGTFMVWSTNIYAPQSTLDTAAVVLEEMDEPCDTRRLALMAQAPMADYRE